MFLWNREGDHEGRRIDGSEKRGRALAECENDVGGVVGWIAPGVQEKYSCSQLGSPKPTMRSFSKPDGECKENAFNLPNRKVM